MRHFFFALTTAAMLSFSANSYAAPATTATTAPAPAANTNVVAKESPWTMSCQPEATDGKVNCEVTKQLVTQDGASLIAQISVFKTGQDLMMRIIAPHQLSIATGLGLSIDDKDAGTKPFTTSLPAGIVALFTLDDSILPIIRKGQVLKFTTKTRASQDLSFSLSLNGFAPSLDKMAK